MEATYKLLGVRGRLIVVASAAVALAAGSADPANAVRESAPAVTVEAQASLPGQTGAAPSSVGGRRERGT